MNSFESQFHLRLHKKISEQEATLLKNLGGGGPAFIRDDAAATGMNYARQVGYLEALKHVLALCDETINEMTKGK